MYWWEISSEESEEIPLKINKKSDSYLNTSFDFNNLSSFNRYSISPPESQFKFDHMNASISKILIIQLVGNLTVDDCDNVYNSCLASSLLNKRWDGFQLLSPILSPNFRDRIEEDKGEDDSYDIVKKRDKKNEVKAWEEFELISSKKTHKEIIDKPSPFMQFIENEGILFW